MLAFLLLYVSTLQAESLISSDDYEQIEQVWDWLLDVSPPKPRSLSGQLYKEIAFYSDKRGYLWPENTNIVEDTLTTLSTKWVNNAEDSIHQVFYYPSTGVIPYTAKEYRYLYDVTAGPNQSLRPPKEDVSTVEFLSVLKLNTYFDNKHTKHPNFHSNPASTIYAVIYGEHSQSAEAFDTLVDLCTPSNKVMVDGKLRKAKVEQTFEDIAMAFMTLSQLETNYAIAMDYRNQFIERVEKPLKHITDFSDTYMEESGQWPENRRKYVDQCRVHFEEAGRLEVLIARSKQ